MEAIEIIPRRPTSREDDLLKAAILGTGAVVVGGLLCWTWSRSRPHRRNAPGWPGATPHWSFASKDGIGTALAPAGGPHSRVWFTLRHVACTEIFHPRV